MPTGELATAGNRTVAEIGGEMTVNGQGDVNLISEGDLTLNLNTDTNHVEITTSDETGAGDITIVSRSTDPLTGSALSITELIRDIEFVFRAYGHQLQTFGPTFDNTVEGELNRLAALVRTIENSTIDEGTLVMYFDG